MSSMVKRMSNRQQEQARILAMEEALKTRTQQALLFAQALAEAVMAHGEGDKPTNGAASFDRHLFLPSSGIDFEGDNPTVHVEPRQGGRMVRLGFPNGVKASTIAPVVLTPEEEARAAAEARAEEEAAGWLEQQRAAMHGKAR